MWEFNDAMPCFYSFNGTISGTPKCFRYFIMPNAKLFLNVEFCDILHLFLNGKFKDNVAVFTRNIPKHGNGYIPNKIPFPIPIPKINISARFSAILRSAV